jgi:DNA polymerase elongation subunit (family B)
MYQNIYTNVKDNKAVIFDDERGMVEIDYEPYAYVKNPNGNYTAIDGTTVERTTKFRRGAPNTYESDIPMDTRILIDLYGDEDTPSKNHCILNFDIESDGEGGYAQPDDPWQPITSIAFKDSVSKKRRVYIIDFDKIISDSEYDDDRGSVIVKRFDSEQEMLEAFMTEYTKIKPTIIIGWNIWGYDIPYLYNRLKKVFNTKFAKRLSPIGVAFVSDKQLDGTFDCTIAGVSCLDYLKLYRIFTYTQLANYRLGTVGMFEVGMDKVEYDGRLHDLFKTDIKKFVNYNMTDVDIVDAIDNKMKLVELTMGICHICHVPYECIKFSSRFLEGAVLTYLRSKGLVATNRPPKIKFKDDEEEGFAGAFVKAPIPGRYEWIFSNDLASLYPSIIRSLNISPETKVGKVINWDTVKHDFYTSFDRIKDGSKLTVQVGEDIRQVDKQQFNDMLVNNNFSLSSNGVFYNQSKRGIIPEILDKWYAERKHYKKLMVEASDKGDKVSEEYYDRRQLIQKVFLNSLYGVLGLNGWRWYDLDNALAVTATGQDIIKATANKGNAEYVNLLVKSGANENDICDNDYVTYIDTDSNYLSNKPLVDQIGISHDEEKCKILTIKTSNHLVEKINEYYDDLMSKAFNAPKHFIKTEGETIGRTGIWIAKKRYAIHKIYDLEKHKDVDKFHIKGLDVVRSSFPVKFKNFMLDGEHKHTGIISDFLLFENKSVIDEKILKFKREVGTYPVEEVARNTSVKELSKFEKHCKECVMGQFPVVKDDKGRKIPFPAHIKAALNFNSFIKHYNLEKSYECIFDGEKIKYVYLRRNEFGLETIAFRGYQDPPELLKFIDKYADGNLLYENEMAKKLDDFYDALKWDYPSEGTKIIDAFFGGEDEAVTIKRDTLKTKKEKPKHSKTVNDFFEF